MSDDKVILNVLPPSSNSGVLRCFLLASEIPFEEKNVWGATRTPEYIAKFPNNCAPSIEHGDFTLSETTACMRYLCKAMPEKAGQFYSDDIQKAAKIDMVCDMINTGLCPFISKAVYPTLGFPSYPGDVANMDETKEHTEKSQKAAAEFILQYLNDKVVGIFLAKHKFLLTDEKPTIADFRLAPMLSQIKCGVVMPERLNEYLKAMAEVPGYAEGAKPFDEFNSQKWTPQS